MSVDRRAFLRTSLAAALAPAALLAQTEQRHMLQMNGYPVDAETPLALLTDYITPIDLFFVRSHWVPRMPDLKKWRLKVDGDIEHANELSLSDLKRMPHSEVTCVLMCAGNGRAFHQPNVPGVQCFTELAEMLRITDALVCLLPLTPETRGILNGRNLGLLKKHGCVINVARGGHLVMSDLLRELDSGHLAHAYLDVFDHEPLVSGDALWSHPGVTVTPHSAALTEPRTAIPKIVENVERVRRGETPHHLVDFAAGY